MAAGPVGLAGGVVVGGELVRLLGVAGTVVGGVVGPRPMARSFDTRDWSPNTSAITAISTTTTAPKGIPAGAACRPRLDREGVTILRGPPGTAPARRRSPRWLRTAARGRPAGAPAAPPAAGPRPAGG